MSIDINKLCQLAQGTNEHSDDRAEILAEFYAATQSDTIIELLNRLEAAEKERDDAKAAAENIALKLDYLRSKLETAKNAQNDWLRANAPGGWIDNLRVENEALRAKVARMELQEPVAWMLNCPTLGGDTGWILSWTQSGAGLCNRLSGEENEKKLYALPVAQGEEK